MSFESRGGAASLMNTIASALHIVFIAITAAALVRSLHEQPVLPSATAVNEARFIFDVALILDFQQAQQAEHIR